MIARPRRRPSLTVVGLLLLCGLSALPGWAQAQKLRAAAVKVDITPDRPQHLRGYGPRVSTGVHQPIHHRVLVLDDGQRRLLIVSTEVCLVSPTDYDELAAQVEKTYGIAPVDFLWTVTHTHSAPEWGGASIGRLYMPQRHVHEPDLEYPRQATEKLLAAVGQAIDALEPAQLGVAWGRAEANINRRENRDGKIVLGKNPEGPVDRHIGVIHLRRPGSGQAIATLANYAIHATVLGSKNLLISGDAPGVVAEQVEAQTGAPLLFINGAAGNIAPLYSVFPTPEEGHLDEFKTLLGDPILETLDGISDWRSAPQFQSAEFRFESPRKEGMGWPETWGAYTRDDPQGKLLVIMPCRLLRIDQDIAIWTAPVELFCEVALEVREHSPFPFTFFYGYTNGWIGYLPTREAFAEGGYEPGVTPFTDAAASALTEQVLKELRQQTP